MSEQESAGWRPQVLQRLDAVCDLIAACKAAVAWRALDGDGITDPTRTQLVDAIAKAEAKT